jgi:isopenicillin N synthase-like dioxygenase
MAELPIIDFGPFLSPESPREARRASAEDIDRACRTSGFFYLRNHGVPQDMLNGIREVARSFFENVTAEEKQYIAVKRPNEGGDNARGYLKVTDTEKGSHEVGSVLCLSSDV